MRNLASLIVSTIVGPVLPPDVKALGRVDLSSVTLHLIESGGVKTYEPQEQGLATNVQEWVGYRWVPQNGLDENRTNF